MKSGIRGAIMASALAAAVGGSGFAQYAYPTESARRNRKPYPTMITSSPAEITAWNEAVTTRQVMRRKNRTSKVRRVPA